MPLNLTTKRLRNYFGKGRLFYYNIRALAPYGKASTEKSCMCETILKLIVDLLDFLIYNL